MYHEAREVRHGRVREAVAVRVCVTQAAVERTQLCRAAVHGVPAGLVQPRRRRLGVRALAEEGRVRVEEEAGVAVVEGRHRALARRWR